MADITFFQTENEAGEMVLKERGVTRSIEYVKQRLSSMNDKAIELMLPLVADGLNWAKYDEWLERKNTYDNAMIVYQTQLSFYNSSDNKDTLIEPVAPTAPEPLEVEPVTVDAVRSMLSSEIMEKQKENREGEFSALTVEHNGFVYDADRQARSAIVETVTMMQIAGIEVHPWKMADNTWHDVSLDDLVQVGLKISTSVMAIMQKYEA